MEALDQTVWLNINYRTWQGKKQLSRAEIIKYSNPDELPPEDLITPGSKAIADPEGLKKITSLGKKINRECEKVCVRAFGAYATSNEASETLLAKLEGYKKEHQDLVSAYLDSYEQSNEEWMAAHPQWEAWLRHSMLSRQEIEYRFKFEVQAYKISSGGEGTLLNDGLQKEQSGLLGTLFREIEKMADDAWSFSYENKEKVSQKALRPILTIKNKLETLSYIDGKVSVLVRRVKAVLDAMPKSGFIEGADLSAACGLLNLLSSSNRMNAFAKQAHTDATATVVPVLDDDDDVEIEVSEVLPLDVAEMPKVDETDEYDDESEVKEESPPVLSLAKQSVSPAAYF
tara:strand:- start:17928 stop:18956 length:1029 start_codon:yes stop_codon:yes gene_type:complete